MELKKIKYRVGIIVFIIVIVVVMILVFAKHRTKVEQEVQSYGNTELTTYVYYKGEVVESWYDYIDSTFNDTMKCYRYNQGMRIIERLERIDDIDCN